MSYRVKEMVYTLQGEGANAGMPVILCRFSGCNLACAFCDTDHTGTDGPGGGEFDSAGELADTVAARSGEWSGCRTVLCTGGEPLLQLDHSLVKELSGRGYRILLETNGTIPVPMGVHWICVSPKPGGKLEQLRGDELKLPFPWKGLDPQNYAKLDFKHFYLQPVFGENIEKNTRKALEYCLGHPRWRLSLQLHRILKIP